MNNNKHAVMYRMVMEEHVCPFGIKAVSLLKRKGYSVEDNHLTTREATDEFKAQHGVSTTPQIFINDQRIGGYTDLQHYFGKTLQSDKETTYRPVIAIFAVAALMALALDASSSSLLGWATIGNFIAITMCILAIQKLQDLEAFTTMFLGYDLLAKRWVPYAYFYPFAEMAAGVLMLGGIFNFISIPLALFIGSVGAWSVFYAVYIEKRELKCACVGGNSSVPLGFTSLSENLAMIAMALGMLIALL